MHTAKQPLPCATLKYVCPSEDAALRESVNLYLQDKFGHPNKRTGRWLGQKGVQDLSLTTPVSAGCWIGGFGFRLEYQVETLITGDFFAFSLYLS
jgi:hypothetical protein